MAYSYVVYTGNGSTTQFSVSFPYLRREHVVASVNRVAAAFTWVNDNTVQISPAPANGARVEVRRITPVNAPLVDFADGSTPVAADFDTNALQQTYINQEQDDQIQDGVFVNAQGNLDANAKRITDVANPVDAQDVATKDYVDDLVASGLLPDGNYGDVTVSDSGTAIDINAGAIVDGDINASAAIAGTKISPNFGSQNVVTTGGIEGASLNGGSLAGMRNMIINGSFDIAQRGTSGTAVSGSYSLDCWITFFTGTAVAWSKQAAGTVSDSYFVNIFRAAGASGNTGFTLSQRIEADNIAYLAGKTVTISAYVLQTTGSARNVSFLLDHANSKDNWSTSTSIGSNATSIPNNTWTKMSWTTTLPASGTPNGISLGISFGALGSGQLAQVAGVQIEPGSIATPFERRPIGTEFALCLWYYETGSMYWGGYNLAGGSSYTSLQFKATKRVIPTLSYAIGSATNVSVADIRNPSRDQANWFAQITADGAFAWNGTWAASAEL